AAQQARADRRGPGGSFASLLFMRALRRRPIARRCRTGYRKYGILSRGTPHAGDRRPGGALRSWPRTEESSGRSGGDYQIRGAYRGGHRSRYRSARTSRDPQSPPVGPARGCRRADAHPVRAAGWDGRAGGEERDGRSAAEERERSGPDSGRVIYAGVWGRGWSCALQKVVIGDGAEWIWNLVGLHFPGATQIVDLYHARQHLWEVARRLFPNEEGKQKAWMKIHQKRLLDR